MRKLVLVGLTVTTVLAVAAVAIAQYAAPVVRITNAKITPATGGKKKKPKNAGVDVTFEVNEESNSTLSAIDYRFPKSLKVSAEGFPKCSAAKAQAGTCPKKSQVGTGSFTAVQGPGRTPLNFTAKVVTAGTKKLFIVLNNDSLGNILIRAAIKGRHLRFKIPENVQKPVDQPGQSFYSYITSVTADLGPAKVGKGRSRHFLISRIGCRGGKDTIGVTLTLADNPNPPPSRTISDTASVPCKK